MAKKTARPTPNVALQVNEGVPPPYHRSIPSTTYLLDVNVLIALAWPLHVHHARAHRWFERIGKFSWATCPLTQLAFVRISSNPKIIRDAVSPRAATNLLNDMVALQGHVFWPDDLPVNQIANFSSPSMVGHRQVTDAFLLALAQHHHAKLATLDAGLADLVAPTARAAAVELISDADDLSAKK
jgi:uncharacterized protein